MKSIVSPMAGTVLQVLTEVGEQVKSGETVVMLESMKMEIPVEAAEAGKIAEIQVSLGDFVNEGDVLLIIE